MAERIAVADLGSNSFRLVVFTARRRLVEAHRRDLRGRAHRRGPGRDRRAGRARRWRARWRRWRSSRTSARPAASSPTTSHAVATQRHPRRRQPAEFLERAQAASGLRGARAQRRGGGPLRLPGRGQLDHARRRRRARPRRRLDAARARRRPPLARARLVAPGRGADDRALPARRRPGQAQAARASCARYVTAQARARAVARPLRARGWSASAARSATSPPPRSATPELPRSGVQGYVIDARGARRPGRRARVAAAGRARRGARASSPRAATSSSPARSSCRR